MTRKTRLIDFVLIVSALLIASHSFAADAAPTNKVLLGLGEAVNLEADESQALLVVAAMALKERNQSTVFEEFTGSSRDELEALRQKHGAARVIVIDATRVGEILVVLVRSSDGGNFRSHSLQLNSLNEYPVAIARVVDALLSKRKFTETATTATLVGRETRTAAKSQGEFLWGLGINFGTNLSSGVTPRYGMNFRAMYEMLNWRIDSEMSVMGSDAEDNESFLSEWNLGLAYIFGDRSWAPFTSAGLGLVHQMIKKGAPNPSAGYYDYDSDRNRETGLGFYVGGGIELFRFHNTRLIAEARVVMPAFTLNIQGDDKWVPIFKSNVSFVF